MRRIPPMPIKDNPYAQVDFIFNLVAEMKSNKHTKSNYTTALTYYKKFLDATNNYDLDLKESGVFYLDTHWNEMALVNFKKYIDSTNKKGTEGYLTSHSIVGIFSAVRTVMKEAIVNNYTFFNNLIDVSIGTAGRETDVNIAYSENEMKQINVALKEELRYVYRVYRKDGYKPKGVGADPRIRENHWNDIDNMRWYFENVLDFEPILGTPENKLQHKSYVEYAPTKYYKKIGGLRGIYREWGVAPLIDVDLMMPLVVQLAIQTGLNVHSLLELELDCFEEKNPISGVPVLRYVKARSSGEKELHINTYENNGNVELKEFRQDQVKIIKNTIKVIIDLTENIRLMAPLELQNKLFIIQSNSQKILGTIMEINKKVTSNWCQNFVGKYDLKNDSNEKMTFNLKRFRSTKATEMIYKGADLHELQYELGHKNIATTMNYVDKNKLNIKAQQETTAAIEKIFANKAWAEENEVQYAYAQTENENVIFKGFLCDCKNPFNPPDDVKKLKDYQSGNACSRMNMCLFCDNVMVFKRNLPSLWLYKKQIEEAMEVQSTELPNEHYYLKTLDIINALFDENVSEFSSDDIQEAKELSENLDELIDPVTYRAELER